MGSMIGAIISMVIFVALSKSLQGNQNMLLIPSIVAYTCVPFFHSLREKIYYKFYENGNNFMFLPSLSEVVPDENVTRNEDITVDV